MAMREEIQRIKYIQEQKLEKHPSKLALSIMVDTWRGPGVQWPPMLGSIQAFCLEIIEINNAF